MNGPNSGVTSKTTTGQHRDARQQQAKATALPEKSKPSFANSRYGLFPTRPAIDQQQVLQDAAGYLEQEKPTAINFEPKNTVENMIKHAAGNFIKNTIVTEVTPIVKAAVDFSELNLTIAPLVIGGAELVVGYGAASIATQGIIYNASLNAISGAYGSASTGGDKWSIATSAVTSASIGLLGNPSSRIGRSLLNPYIASAVSNISGQLITFTRNPDDFNPSLISPLVSFFGTGLAEAKTAGIAESYLIKTIVGGMVDAAAGGIGSDLAKRHKW